MVRTAERSPRILWFPVVAAMTWLGGASSTGCSTAGSNAQRGNATSSLGSAAPELDLETPALYVRSTAWDVTSIASDCVVAGGTNPICTMSVTGELMADCEPDSEVCLGHATFEQTMKLDMSGVVSGGSYALVDGNGSIEDERGNRLYFEISDARGLARPDEVNFETTFRVNGGSGRFEGFSGVLLKYGTGPGVDPIHSRIDGVLRPGGVALAKQDPASP